MSNEPIHGSERLPTKEDGRVQYWNGECWIQVPHDHIHDGEWWKPLDQTPPPEPPLSARKWFERHSVPFCGSQWHKVDDHSLLQELGYCDEIYMQVLPGDPNWVELLEAIDNRREGGALAWERRVMETRNRNV